MSAILQKRIGIIGGGQLGKMMILEAKKMNFYIVVLDPNPKCPAHNLVDRHIVAGFDDRDAINDLADNCDVLTYEFEHINADALLALEERGKTVYPTAKSLKIIQNKLTQKEILKNGGIPVPDFMPVSNAEDIRKAALCFGYPVILKTTTGGYDGKGNYYISGESSVDDGFAALGNGKLGLMAEKFADFTMETSVLVCRSPEGETVVYPVGENIHYDNILFETRVPADISPGVKSHAMDIARQVMEIFDGVGMFCIEMFVCGDDTVLVNEVAPRPHNSGHYTIEGCVTSQFEQHIRAVAGLPLGDVSLLRPTVMRNILGEDGSTGAAMVEGIHEALRVRGAKVHIYGKDTSAPNRKMGHITVTAETLAQAAENCKLAKDFIRIRGSESKSI